VKEGVGMGVNESYLSQRIFLAFLILVVLWHSLGFLGIYIIDAMALDAISAFIFRFFIRAALLLGIVPFILKIPNGQRSYTEYLEDINSLNTDL
jgi:hypothetical protein